MNEVNNGSGGHYDPYSPTPTPDDYKRQWQHNYRNREIEQQRKADKSRKQAIKEILQDQVKNAVKPNEKLDSIFRQQFTK